MKSWIFKRWQENKLFLLFIIIMFAFRSAIADWNQVPSGSMKPTILEGDRIFVNHMAYDIRIPFTQISLFQRSNPLRGDIVVFESQVSDRRLVKRVIGIPGDVIELNNNVLTINGEQLRYKLIAADDTNVDQLENLLGVKHLIRINKQGSNLANFQSGIIPADNYLALGDNRDNSADSRVIGLVPRQEIMGRSKHVVLSLDYENYYIPRKDRFFKEL